MRKIVLCGLMLLAVAAQAAEYRQDSMFARRDPFYLQLYGGVNKSANENLPWTEFSSYPWAGGAFLGVGREFSRTWGWRAALRVNHNKSRNVPECESPDTYGWNSTALFADLTYDVSDALGRRDSVTRSRFNLKAFLGVGGSYTWSFDQVPLSYSHPYSRASRLAPAARAGLTATYRLSPRWRLGAELSNTIFGDRFNGVAYDTPLDMRTNLKVGLTYLFLKRKRKPVEPVMRINRLKETPALHYIAPDPEEVKMRQIKGHAFLDFPVNETVIYPDYRKNPDELARIEKSIDSVLFDKSVTITSISLHGYASPESPYSNNTRLAKGRTEALKMLLMRKYDLDAKVFKTNYTPEDWDNLRGFLTDPSSRRVKGDFWYDNKAFMETPEMPDFVMENRNELLRIIGSNIDPDVKNEKLKTVAGGEPYRWLLEHVYPGLRHTDYIIEYKVRPFSVKQGRRLIYSHPEALSLEEMHQVAMSYPEGSDNWMDAMMIAVEQYPDDPSANYNAAAACVKTKRLKDAKKYLAKAGNNRSTQYLSNVIKAMEGNVQWRMENNRLRVGE